MMNQKLEEFYQKKTDRELYRIYLGIITDSYSARLLVKKILQDRGFDFEHVEKYKDKWELEKLLQDIEEEQQGWQLGPSLFSPFFSLITGILFLLVSPIMVITAFLGENRISEHYEINLFLHIPLFVIGIFLGVGFIRYSAHRRKEIMDRKLKIDHLTRKLINQQ